MSELDDDLDYLNCRAAARGMGLALTYSYMCGIKGCKNLPWHIINDEEVHTPCIFESETDATGVDLEAKCNGCKIADVDIRKSLIPLAKTRRKQTNSEW